VISVCKNDHSPILTIKLKEEYSLDGIFNMKKDMRRQVLEEYYRINGAIYISKVEYFKRYKNFYKENSFAYIMSRRNSIDIDNQFDFDFADFLLNLKK